MSARPSPKGQLPETKVTAVKSESAPEVEAKADAEVAENTDVEETDLKDLEEKGKIPYSRFQQVNEKAKRTEKQLADLSRKYDEDVKRAMFEKEVALQAANARREKATLDLDGPSSETRALKEELAKLRSDIAGIKGMTGRQQLNSQIKDLVQRFPEADELAVLGWKQNQPDTDLEELMEFSHNRNLERDKKNLQGIIEKKRAKKSPPATVSSSSGFEFKIDEKDKPKTVEEAGKMLRRFFNGK
jgi:acylphosphatase